jgi:hypothetical protein
MLPGKNERYHVTISVGAAKIFDNTHSLNKNYQKTKTRIKLL